MAEVFVAQDAELNRMVAIKEIARGDDHPDTRARFLLEAEITARLEHPGVVPIHGLGHYADGRPFIAMRFIRGESLKEAIDRSYVETGASGHEQLLQLRQLLRRFLDVCQTIDYAHNRGIVHRDIKPTNIMLGPFGETIVIDWGLAKPMDRTGSEPIENSAGGALRPQRSLSKEEVLGMVIGTPGYIGPEQARGDLNRMGPTSDIYSLGATLYTILTGRSPVEGSSAHERLSRAIRGDFLPPRIVNERVPRPLEAICLKAMSLRPEDRYPSARALSEDIERWLADEPISAYRESWLRRVWRYLRHTRIW
jgi:serine/threonine protein kinase